MHSYTLWILRKIYLNIIAPFFCVCFVAFFKHLLNVYMTAETLSCLSHAPWLQISTSVWWLNTFCYHAWITFNGVFSNMIIPTCIPQLYPNMPFWVSTRFFGLLDHHKFPCICRRSATNLEIHPTNGHPAHNACTFACSTIMFSWCDFLFP